jgi:hypothetical protein
MITLERATRLRDQVRQARLQTEVAIDVVPLIADVVEDHDARRLVVQDIVVCWMLLPSAVQAAYAEPRFTIGPLATDEPKCPAISRFIDDYVDEVDRIWTAKTPPEGCLSRAELRTRCREGRYDFVESICERATAEQSPPAEWLARFPVVDSEPPRDGPDAEGDTDETNYEEERQLCQRDRPA